MLRRLLQRVKSSKIVGNRRLYVRSGSCQARHSLRALKKPSRSCQVPAINENLSKIPQAKRDRRTERFVALRCLKGFLKSSDRLLELAATAECNRQIG